MDAQITLLTQTITLSRGEKDKHIVDLVIFVALITNGGEGREGRHKEEQDGKQEDRNEHLTI